MVSGPLVSVVVPFYNTEEYLQECIESVLSQTYTHFELILQNNCSTDGSWAIAQRFASEDSRIRLFSNERFLTQVQNYNAALEWIAPQSKYTKIVQADDSIFPRCLEEMVAVAESDPMVGLVSSYTLRGTKVSLDGYPFPKNVVSGREVCRYELLTDYGFHGSPTTVMYRSEIVRERRPFYDEGKYHEDTENCFEVLEHWKFGYVKQLLTFCRVDPDSIMSRIARMDPSFGVLSQLILMRRFGRRYLSEDEFRQRWSLAENEYLRHIGYSAWSVRDPAFWNYHRRGLASIDYPMSRWRIRFLALSYLLLLPIRPGEIMKVLKGLHKGFHARWKPPRTGEVKPALANHGRELSGSCEPEVEASSW